MPEENQNRCCHRYMTTAILRRKKCAPIAVEQNHHQNHSQGGKAMTICTAVRGSSGEERDLVERPCLGRMPRMVAMKLMPAVVVPMPLTISPSARNRSRLRAKVPLGQRA